MHTLSSLTEDLQMLGLPECPVWLVHSGFRSLGAVEGGPATLIAALRAALGPQTTIAAPTFTTQLIDPYTWPSPPSDEERQIILHEMPSFDPDGSPPYRMGAVSEALWRTPGAVRSRHPVTSWAALGPLAEPLTANIPLEDPEGIDGVVGRTWRADGAILLIGVDHDANTSIHLAESLLDMPHLRVLPDRYPVDERGHRIWREITKTTKCSDGFVKIQLVLQRVGIVSVGRVGDALVQWMRSRDLVRATAALLSRDPTALLCDDPDCVHCPTSREALRGFAPTSTPPSPPPPWTAGSR